MSSFQILRPSQQHYWQSNGEERSNRRFRHLGGEVHRIFEIARGENGAGACGCKHGDGIGIRTCRVIYAFIGHVKLSTLVERKSIWAIEVIGGKNGSYSVGSEF